MQDTRGCGCDLPALITRGGRGAAWTGVRSRARERRSCWGCCFLAWTLARAPGSGRGLCGVGAGGPGDRALRRMRTPIPSARHAGARGQTCGLCRAPRRVLSTPLLSWWPGRRETCAGRDRRSPCGGHAVLPRLQAPVLSHRACPGPPCCLLTVSASAGSGGLLSPPAV